MYAAKNTSVWVCFCHTPWNNFSRKEITLCVQLFIVGSRPCGKQFFIATRQQPSSYSRAFKKTIRPAKKQQEGWYPMHIQIQYLCLQKQSVLMQHHSYYCIITHHSCSRTGDWVDKIKTYLSGWWYGDMQRDIFSKITREHKSQRARGKIFCQLMNISFCLYRNKELSSKGWCE